MANLRVDKITSTETFETTGSVQFDGTGDYLELANNEDFQFGTGDWSIEFWWNGKPTGTYTAIITTLVTSNESGTWRVGTRFQSNNQLYFARGTGSGFTDVRFNVDVNDSLWHHIAFVRSNGVIIPFVDGIDRTSDLASGSVSDSNTMTTTNNVRIGYNQRDNAYINGYISNLRICKGKALYTSNFKPSMRELEVTPETVLLACQSKTDASHEKTGKTITVNGNAVASELTPGILTPIPKAGAGSAITGSVEFTSTTDALVLSAGTDFAYGTGDFTIEAWIQPQGINGGETKAIFTQTQSGNDYIVFKVDSDKAIKATFGSTTVSGGTVEVGSWHHVAVTRASNTVRIFVNGVASAGTTVSTDFSDTTRNPTIGQYTHTYGNIEYYGFISNLRVNKGTALYTDDFIPPTRELKKVPGTVLLCCQDPNNPLTEATGKTITGYGDLDQVYNTQLVPNGDFSNGINDWSDTGSTATLSVSSGQMTITNSSGTNGRATGSAFKTTIGAKYILKYDAITSGGSYRAEIREGGGAGAEQAFESTTDGATETFEFQATHSQHSVVIYSIGANGIATKYDNVYVYKLNPGKTGSNFTPQVGDDRKVTFEGVTKINSDAYFYLPTGDTVTRESRSGYGNRGLFSLSAAPAASNIIEFVNISSTGNAQDFGDLKYKNDGSNASCSSSTRGIFAGGRENPSPGGNVDHINHVTIATKGDAIDFGNLTEGRRGITGHSSSIRGMFAGGRSDPGGSNPTDVIDFITITSTGNAIDFGNLSQARRYLGSTSSPVRGVMAGGHDGSDRVNTMDYVSIPSKGNAIDFGNLTQARDQVEGNSNGVRGIFGGGSVHPTYYNIIDYVTIASTGNAKDFGDLLGTTGDCATASNCIRGVFAGGNNPTKQNVIQYVNISSMGNAFDFGDLTAAASEGSGCSDSHGGLG